MCSRPKVVDFGDCIPVPPTEDYELMELTTGTNEMDVKLNSAVEGDRARHMLNDKCGGEKIECNVVLKAKAVLPPRGVPDEPT